MCGDHGATVHNIVEELNGEDMDVGWIEDQQSKNTLNPTQVLKVEFNSDNNGCIVVVPDHQLSLTIGKRGQNA